MINSSLRYDGSTLLSKCGPNLTIGARPVTKWPAARPARSWATCTGRVPAPDSRSLPGNRTDPSGHTLREPVFKRKRSVEFHEPPRRTLAPQGTFLRAAPLKGAPTYDRPQQSSTNSQTFPSTSSRPKPFGGKLRIGDVLEKPLLHPKNWPVE